MLASRRTRETEGEGGTWKVWPILLARNYTITLFVRGRSLLLCPSKIFMRGSQNVVFLLWLFMDNIFETVNLF